MNKKTIGLIINPIAGMGGRVGLKGTDGIEILNKAKQLGASSEAPNLTLHALRRLEPIKDDLLILTASADMGENQCKSLGFPYRLVHKFDGEPERSDTIQSAKKMEEMGADLILFAGGDGTARDIYKAVESRTVVLGIPAGVKIHSPVYGINPQLAGKIALLYLKDGSLPVKEEEVVDIDEEAYRNNQVKTRLFGYLKVPYQEEYLQNKKAPTPLSEEASQRATALDIVDHMVEDVHYLVGPGTTTRAVMEELKLQSTLLGVDIIKNKKLVKLDCNEQDILDILGNNGGKLIITPTGGQGYLLGRGNQQISPKVLERIGKENIIIISPNSKLVDLRGKPLLIDTGSESIDKSLAGYYRIKIGYGMDVMYKISAGAR